MLVDADPHLDSAGVLPEAQKGEGVPPRPHTCWEIRVGIGTQGLLDWICYKTPPCAALRGKERTGKCYLSPALRPRLVPAPGWVVPDDASVGREERIQDWDTCRKQAPVAACGQLLPLLGDVSHSLGVGPTGLFLEVGMRRISWQRRCS